MMHPSRWENHPGGIKTVFEPNLHYVEYTRENFEEQAAKWISPSMAAKRSEMARNARKIILDGHTWTHRAKQILEDLN